MPPYVTEDQRSVMMALQNADLGGLEKGDFDRIGDLGPCARAAVTTAYYDLIAKEKGSPIADLVELDGSQKSISISLVTLGLCPISGIPSNLVELPPFKGLKIKLDGKDDLERIASILEHDTRPILIDANQAWTSLEQALNLVQMIPAERLLGVEQPFPVDRSDLQRQLHGTGLATIYADESIQDQRDMLTVSNIFGGVNLKLMKCGGLDRAADLAKCARDLGLRIMLGSMSESSIGCAAMFQLASMADVIDLDGPWLIQNDPFKALGLRQGSLMLTSSVEETFQAKELNWTPIGA